MGLSHAPRVITDGIVLGLDAANTRSYVGSGTTWTDLIGSNNGTLNGPVFTQEPKLEPFGGAGAVEFDGNGDYLSIPATADFDLGSAKTYECWFKLDTISTNKLIGGSVNNHWLNIGHTGLGNSANKVGFSVGTGVGAGFSWNAVNGTTNIAAGSWYHVAATWDGTNVKLYLNGVLEATSADWSAKTWASNNGYEYNIGAVYQDLTTSIDGVISNFRITDSVVYTSNFTPPRKKLEVTSDTILLTCEKGTIRDRSPSAHAITINGDAKSISGASYFEFDGTNDYIIGDTPNGLDLSQPCSVDVWVYFDSFTQVNPRIIEIQDSVNSIQILRDGSSTRLATKNSNFQSGTSSTTWFVPSVSNWYNIIVIWEPSTSSTTLYLDGVLQTAVGSTPVGAGNQPNKYVLGVRSDFIATTWIDGRIGNVRVYSRALTASEVSQNYNALRGRYGI